MVEVYEVGGKGGLGLAKDLENASGAIAIGIQEAFDGIDWKPFLGNQVIPAMQQMESEYFESETDPNGTAWPELAQSTIDAKGHDTILVETNKLKSSLIGETGDSVKEVVQEGKNAGATWGTSVEYARFHQAKDGRLPQRAMVGLSERNVDALTESTAGEAVRQLVESGK